MLHVGMLALLLLQQTTVRPAQEPTPGQGQPASQPTYDQGPLRVSFVAMRELRFARLDPEAFRGMESEMRLQVRVEGQRVDQIARNSDLILDEMVDDTGLSLLEKPATDADRNFTLPTTQTPDRLIHRGLEIMIKAKPSARAARQLAKVRGSVRVILADKEKGEKITIENPFQYFGKLIENPRLKELGISVRVAPFDEFSEPIPPDRVLILQYKTKPEHVQETNFYDGSMRPLAKRENRIVTSAGEECMAYMLDPGSFNTDLQVVFTVHTQIEDLRLPFNIDNYALP